MRICFLCLALLLAIEVNAIIISDNVVKALSKMDKSNFAEAVNLITQAASTNDILAQFYLAQCYENGIGVTMDKAKAFSMYRRAAERGLPAAMKELSRLYSNGIGVYQSEEKALEWSNRFLQKNDSSTFPSILEIYNRNIINPSKEKSQNDINSTEYVNNNYADATLPHPAAEIKTISDPSVYSTSTNETNQEKSDIDVNIPKTNEINSSTFVFIFANENYQEVAKVPFAINDGEIFLEYCNNTLGIPLSNIHLVKNGTINNFKREINIMAKIAEAYKGEVSYIVYYAGHGIPDEDSRHTYLLPSDGFPSDLSTCFRLSDFFDIIGKLPVKRTLVFLDACFSGATRNDDMIVSARGVVLKPKETIPSGNTIVVTSAFGSETSYSYDEKKHGMFTYFLLKKIGESRGKTSINSLFEFVRDNVTKMSIVVNGKSQTPSIIVSPTLGEGWKEWLLK